MTIARSKDTVEKVLKPCPTPWCEQGRGEPYVFERRKDVLGVYCPSCGVSTDYHPNAEAAIEQWNTRAAINAMSDDMIDVLEPFAGLNDVNMNDPLRKWLTVAHIKGAVAALESLSGGGRK